MKPFSAEQKKSVAEAIAKSPLLQKLTSRNKDFYRERARALLSSEEKVLDMAMDLWALGAMAVELHYLSDFSEKEAREFTRPVTQAIGVLDRFAMAYKAAEEDAENEPSDLDKPGPLN